MNQDPLKIIVAFASVGFTALVIGCNNNHPSHATTSTTGTQSQSSQSSAHEQSSADSLRDTAAELHSESATLIGISESQYRPSLAHSLNLIAKAIMQLDPHPSPAQQQRVQIIEQGASRVSSGASPLEPVINTSLRAAANALESIVRDRFPEHGDLVTLSQRLGEDVNQLDGVHGGLHQLAASRAVGHASDLISQMVASLSAPQPTTAATMPTTTTDH